MKSLKILYRPLALSLFILASAEGYTSQILKDNLINFEDFAKIGFRFGTIVKASDFPKARNPSYKLEVQFGKGIGIKNSSAQLPANYTIDQVLNKKVLGVVNFAPRRIAGFMSEVLIVGFPDDKGKVLLLNTSNYNVSDGDKLAENGQTPPEITYDDFKKVKIRAGTIVSLEQQGTNDPYFNAKLDMGNYGMRTAFFGDLDKDLAQGFINKQVAVLANLQPSCISENSYDATILTFLAQQSAPVNDTSLAGSTSDQKSFLRIPLGVDGKVENGAELF